LVGGTTNFTIAGTRNKRENKTSGDYDHQKLFHKNIFFGGD